ncbi:MAG: M48 family metallopeptidase [Bacteroidetes bacterium]|nr:M48 family metallopeptidase [Bacteroidota bacterium]
MLATFIGIVIVGFILDLVLSYLDIQSWKNELPAEAESLFTTDEYQKALRYARANYNFGLVTGIFSFTAMLALLISGLTGKIFDACLALSNNEWYATLMFAAVMGITADLLNTPFQLYNTFVIEQKFGFNQSTLLTFFADKCKGYLLAAVLGGLVLSAFYFFYAATGSFFWLYCWMAVTVFSLLMMMFYTSWILPLFNKITPLGDGTLRKSITSYCDKVGFTLNNVFVMDGSKRSSKANAFFSGFGARKKIVLFDTLIEQQTEEELVAVLAHEVGHNKKKHTTTFFIASVFQTGLMLFILSFFINREEISIALGSSQHHFALGLIGFFILYEPVSLLTGVFTSYFSRKHEYEADAFAASTYNGELLISALKKLTSKTLSNPFPHPLVVALTFSHPTLMQRIAAIRSIKACRQKGD